MTKRSLRPKFTMWRLILSPCVVLAVLGPKLCVSSHMKGKIVNGAMVPITEVPHAVLMVIGCQDNGQLYQQPGCGASILNQHLIITAAHCLENLGNCPDMVIRFVIGKEDLYGEAENFVEKYLVHENYNKKTVQHDIALLKLKTPLELNEARKRVAIVKNMPTEFKSLYVAGWGLTDESGYFSPKRSMKIKRADLVILPREDPVCVDLMVPEGHFCTSNDRNSENYDGYPSSGDSGSGLIMNDYIIVGVVSYKVMMLSKRAVVFTNVSYHYDWIVKSARLLLCNNHTHTPKDCNCPCLKN